ERAPSAQAAVQANRAFTSDRGGFCDATIPAEDQQRDEAGLREVDVLDRVARLKEDCSLLERDMSQMPLWRVAVGRGARAIWPCSRMCDSRAPLPSRAQLPCARAPARPSRASWSR